MKDAEVKPSLMERLSRGVVLGDGAMGTLLYERGLPLDRSCEELVLTQPDAVRRIHEDYLAAGSELIETNTFGANRLKLAKYGLQDRVGEINRAAAEVAARVVQGGSALVAGSVGPMGIRLEEAWAQGVDIRGIFTEQIQALVEGGVEVFFFETFSDIEELRIAIEAAKAFSQIPRVCMMSFTEEGLTHTGMGMEAAFSGLIQEGARIVGANCCVGPYALVKLYASLPMVEGVYYGAFPNAGKPEYRDGRYFYLSSPAYFAERGWELAHVGVRLIGGCCGTGPEHIAALRERLGYAGAQPMAVKPRVWVKPPVVSVERPVSVSKIEKPALEGESLVEMVRKRTLIVTEFDSPKTLAMEKMLEGARALKAAGTDFLTVADNSLAILRVNCVVASHLVEREVGVRTIVHLACRDRNLIGTQSELMGMHILGLNHVLALTGDPSKVGDSPGATSVYDLNSISLLEGIRLMNSGKTFGGRDLKESTRFVAGCSFNPNVKNLDIQIRRLERKVAAGARFVMTQPIFDRALARGTFEATAGFGLPVLIGVMPLLNTRTTEFLHHEVPGIVIPDSVRERMRGKEGAEGMREGLKIAREITAEILSQFQGIYLITPLVKYETTVELSQAIREGKL